MKNGWRGVVLCEFYDVSEFLRFINEVPQILTSQLCVIDSSLYGSAQLSTCRLILYDGTAYNHYTWPAINDAIGVAREN